ncbi:unnamed protein product, partial [marine sediment metagenome]
SPTEPRVNILSESEIEIIIAQAGCERSHERIIPLVFESLMYKGGKTRWLEKTPTHVFYIDDILLSVPDAKFVEIVRDPRAVLASKKRRRETVWPERYVPKQQKFKNLEKSYDP